MQTTHGMMLSDLLAGLSVDRANDTRDPVIGSITEDSRQVSPGALFIARTGLASDGRTFARDAMARGAVAVLSETPIDVTPDVVQVVAKDVPRLAARLAERFHGEPSRTLDLVGVTGTNGKTTTAHLIRQVLESTGRRCGLIGTVEINDGRESQPAALTTPPAIELSGLLRRMVHHGCAACAMEASSHALLQRRVAGLQFRVGIFTNLTGDHLDYHGTMDAYAAAKALLFESLAEDAHAIVNADDPQAARMVRDCSATVWRASLKDAESDLYAELHALDAGGMDATFTGPWGSFRVHLPLVGQHNLMNALEAAGAAHALGAGADALSDALRAAHAPAGRLEPVHGSDDGFSVLVDYAHTDDALENVLRAVRPLVPEGAQLTVVFGCGGDRDRTKRPRMAKVAATHADRIIITSDNPRTEDPASIVREIETGVPAERQRDTETIVDRRVAIQHAVASAGAGDIVLIAGKGHEDYQIIGTTKHPFDDREIARKAIAARRAKVGAA